MPATTDMRRLYKSRTERMLDGVCGGIAEYFGLDATLVRIAWVLLALLGGTGILLYLVAMIIMPTNPDTAAVAAPAPASHQRNSKFWGVLLVVVGSIWFLGNLGLPFWHHWWGFSWDVALPVLLMLAGVAFIFGGRNSLTQAPAPAPNASGFGTSAASPSPPPVPPARLCKSRSEKKMAGVCGGVGVYFGIDPTIVRLIFIVAAFASFGFMLLFYVLMAIVVPKETAAAAV